MATTTTNYGFDVPTSSDLVKNGATQIALLGQDLDTFLFRPFTRNAIINGGFDIWQRGTSLALSAAAFLFSADRWAAAQLGTANAVFNQSTSVPTGFRYSAKIGRNSGATTTGNILLNTALETSDSLRFANQTVTFSFYAKAGANYSSASNALSAIVYTGTGTDQGIGSVAGGWTGSATPINATATLTTSWQRFSYTGTIASTATQLGLGFKYTPVGTAGADDNFYLTGVQVEVGSQASPYAPATPTYATELAACSRYFQVLGKGTGKGSPSTTTNITMFFGFNTVMRTTPTSISYGSLTSSLLSPGVAFYTPSSITIGAGSTTGMSVECAVTGAVVSQPIFWFDNTISFNAEL